MANGAKVMKHHDSVDIYCLSAAKPFLSPGVLAFFSSSFYSFSTLLYIKVKAFFPTIVSDYHNAPTSNKEIIK